MVRLTINRYIRRGADKRGFTLIEIMIVITIIAILLAIAIPNLINARRNSQKAVCIANLRAVQNAKERWATENKKTRHQVPVKEDLYPDYIKNWTTCPGGGTYSINRVADPITCSVGGDHAID